MAQILTADNIPDLVIASNTTITMATTYLGNSTRISIGGQQYRYASTITLNFATTGINGLDTGAIAANTLYYIYAVQSSGVPGLVASLAAPTTGPTGFTSWKEIGRCRTLFSAATLAAVANRDGYIARPGSFIDWQTYVPIVSNIGTAATITIGGRWRRSSGHNMDINLSWQTTGTAGSGASSINFSIAPGYTILLTSLGDSNINNLNAAKVGHGTVINIGTNESVSIIPFSSTALALKKTSSTIAVGADIVAATTIVSFQAFLPIAEWKDLYT